MKKNNSLERHRGKILMLVGVLFILFFMNFASAELLTFDNVKSYDAVKQEVTITNTFGLGADIVKIKLNTPLENKVGIGYVQVAEMEITSYEDYKNLLSEMEFYNIKAGMSKIEVNFDYKYKTYEDYKVDDYEDVISSTLKNGTNVYTRKLVGTHTEQRELWLPLEKLDYVKGEVLTIGIWTTTTEGQNVEWIPTIAGLKINEFATWIAGLNTDLKYYYKLDEPSGTTVLDSTTTLNGVLVAGTVNQAGKIGTAYDFAGGKQGISFNQSYFDYNNPVTINGWVYWDTLTAKTIWTLGGGSHGDLNLILLIAGTKLQIGYLKDTVAWGETLQWSTSPSTGQWYMITVTQTATQNLSMYINGDYIGAVTGSLTSASGISNVIANDFADGPIGTTSPDAKFDEFGFWTRVLSQAEIKDNLYNDNAGNTYTTLFGGVSVGLNSPNNAYKTNNTNVTLNWTIYPNNANITNYTLNIFYANGTLFHTHATIGNLGSNNLTVTHNDILLPDASYIWGVKAGGNNSIDNYQAESVNRTLQVHTTNPNITINNLSNVSVISLPANVTFNVTTSDPELSQCWFVTSDNATKTFYTCNTTTTNATFSTGGSKTITFSANDTFGNSNSLLKNIEIYDFNVTQTGSSTGADGTQSTFTLTINSTSYTMGDANADLWYNGIRLGASTKTVVSSSVIYFTAIVNIPDGTGNATGKPINWFWNYNTTQLTTRNTTTQTQAVYSLLVTDCAVTTGRTILTLNLNDEELNSLVNITSPNTATIELDLTITSLTNSSMFRQFYKKWLNNNTVSVCVPVGVLNFSSFKIEFTVGYDATDHVREFYYLEDGSLDTTNYFNSYTDNTIDLMDLLTVDSTTFLFSFTDIDRLALDDVIVHTFRKYIGEGVFREVERSKQDNNGQTHVHLVEEDVIYYFMVTQGGVIIYTSDTYNAKCLSTPCSIELSASQSSFNWSSVDSSGGLYSVTTNRNTRVVTTAWSLDSISLVNVSLYKNINGTVTLIDTDSLTASAGSIDLTAPLSYGNASFFVSIWRDGNFIKSELVDLTDRGRDYFGTLGAILGGLVVLAMLLMAVSEGAGTIIFLVVSLILIVALKLVDLGWVSLIALVCAGGIIVWKLIDRRNKQG